jgi:amidohydrolase
MKLNLADAARDLGTDLVALRRDIHRHPELGFEEVRTAGLVASRLTALGLPVRTGVGITGVVADLDNGAGPTVALRADMDALPIQEENEHEYRSVNAGVMHACGHDFHTSALVGAARLLVAARDDGSLPVGRIRFLFQPSEERTDASGKSGATRMIEDGALEGVEAVVGLHVGGHAPSGTIFVNDGTVMAGSAEITVRVGGVSAHAAWPERGVDALVLAAQGVTACQQAVARRISPTDSGVVTFGTIHGGKAANIVADEVVLQGTMRYLKNDVRNALLSSVRASFEMLEHHGARVEIAVGRGYVPVVNEPGVTRVVTTALRELAGDGAVLPMERIMAAEDFAFLAERVPGCFFWLGAAPGAPREHHHPNFDIDESVLPLGAAALASAGAALLSAR